MSNGNFLFLQHKYPSLALLGSKAEEYVYSDANASLIKSGMLCDNIVKLICAYNRLELKGDKTDTFASRITKLKREGLLAGEQCLVLHRIREMRNKAAHEDFSSPEASKVILYLIHRVASWFMLVYGGIKSVPAYVEPSADNNSNGSAEPSLSQDRRCKAIESNGRKTNPLAAEKISDTDADLSLSGSRLENRKDEPTAQENELIKQDLKNAQSAEVGTLSSIRERSLRIYNMQDLSEAETRIIIDEQLRAVGFEADSSNLRYSKGARPKAGCNMAIAEWPTDPVVKGGGVCYADYALFVGTKLYAFVEAKSAKKDISSVLDAQCREYSEHVRDEDREYVIDSYGRYKVPFTFACNGRTYIEQYKQKSGVWFLDLRAHNCAPRALRGFLSPQGLEEMLEKQVDKAFARLKQEPYDLLKSPSGLNLRYYQIEAIKAAEQAILDGKTHVLLAMATGTGKTRTVLGFIYRMLKTNIFKRILYLVDRTSLGRQTMDVFKDVELEDFQSLDNIYSINQLEDIKIDRSIRLQISTVQSMVKRIVYATAKTDTLYTMPGVSDYDLVIIDEAHRGYILDKEMTLDEALYTDQRDYISKYRTVVDYFEATKVALTATPALHTVQIFGEPVYAYGYRQAVLDGYLVDFNPPVLIKTQFNQHGITYKKGESIDIYDSSSGQVTSSVLGDELNFDVDDFNRKIIVESFNRSVLNEIADDIDPTFSDDDGKTLIYAVNDAHADMIVTILKEIFEQKGVSDMIVKITGSAEDGNQKKILELIRRFKNERSPAIVVTVDLLTTGIDVPSITKLVFMRRVKSRILYEQMLGRATRRCQDINKDHFEIFDAVNITSSFDEFTDVKPVVANPKQTFTEQLEGLLNSSDDKELNFNLDRLLAKMHRKNQAMDEHAHEQFKRLNNESELKSFIESLSALKGNNDSVLNFVKRHEAIIKTLDSLKSKSKQLIVISDKEDSFIAKNRTYGGEDIRPEDYIDGLRRILEEKKDRIDIIKNICTRPSDLKSSDLKKLLAELETENYTLRQINSAIGDIHRTDDEISFDIITIIRNLLLDEPLVSHKDKVHRAFEKLYERHDFNKNCRQWLKRFEQYLLNDDTAVLSVAALNEDTRFKDNGGFARIDSSFNNELEGYIDEINDLIYSFNTITS